MLLSFSLTFNNTRDAGRGYTIPFSLPRLLLFQGNLIIRITYEATDSCASEYCLGLLVRLLLIRNMGCVRGYRWDLI